jgi:hypothetical protein
MIVLAPQGCFTNRSYHLAELRTASYNVSNAFVFELVILHLANPVAGHISYAYAPIARGIMTSTGLTIVS